MPTLFDTAARTRLHTRVDLLRPDSTAAWGSFSAAQMVAHLNCALRAGLGEISVGPPTGAFRHAPLNLLIIYVLPWPKGGAKSPAEFLGTPPADWAKDIAALHGLIEKTAAKSPAGAWPVSPVFGNISGRSWGALQYKHVDHHLRQFLA